MNGAGAWRIWMQMTDRNLLLTAFLERVGWHQSTRYPLAGDASARRYERLVQPSGSAVLMDAASDGDSVAAFVRIAKLLRNWGYSAPEILAVDMEGGFILLEDLGDGRIADLITDTALEEKLYKLAVDFLISLQRHPVPDDLPRFDNETLQAQGDIFLEYYYTAVTKQQISASAKTEYQEIWQGLYPKMRLGEDVLVMRDFHGENLMHLPSRAGLERLGLLDFQDALGGPALYDLVSLLEDVRRDISPELSRKLIEDYCHQSGLDRNAAGAAYAVLSVYRNLRIAGIFIRLSQSENKARYLKFLPGLWRTVDRYLDHPDLSELKNWFDINLPATQRDGYLKGLSIGQ